MHPVKYGLFVNHFNFPRDHVPVAGELYHLNTSYHFSNFHIYLINSILWSILCCRSHTFYFIKQNSTGWEGMLMCCGTKQDSDKIYMIKQTISIIAYLCWTLQLDFNHAPITLEGEMICKSCEEALCPKQQHY